MDANEAYDWAVDLIERAEDDPGLRPGDVLEVRALAWEAAALTLAEAVEAT